MSPCLNMPAVRAEGIRFRYHAGQSWAIADLDFAASPGEVVGILGPNGSGKSMRTIESCNGQDCHGRPLVINEARPRVPSFGGGGGEGFDRGPGGGGDRPSRGGKGGSRRNKRDKTRERW